MGEAMSGHPVDWPNILAAEGVEYIDKGGKTTAGHVNVKCPLCGDADTGHHMGLNLARGQWYCFRDSSHRGRDPAYILHLLAGIPYEQAKRRVGGPSLGEHNSLDQLSADVLALAGRNATDTPLPTQQWPPEAFVPTDTRGRLYLDYLQGRGLQMVAADLADYNVHACVGGDWAWRLMFPAYASGGRLVGWNARSIAKEPHLRYVSHPKGSILARSVFAHQDLFRRPRECLALCEGPVDAMNIDVHGRDFGLRALSLFSVNMAYGKEALVYEIARTCRRVFVLFDRGAGPQAEQLRSRLAPLHCGVEYVPDHRDDPGEMTPEEVRDLARRAV